MTGLRNRIGREEFDYQALLDALSDYASPRDCITRLLRNGTIIRIKKGLYIFGETDRREPYSRELLANLIYGPSYISFESALSFYGLIPERVESMLSVTTGRSREFDTPIGRFVYHSTRKNSFGLGVLRIAEGRTPFLIASPERALADKIRSDRRGAVSGLAAMREYLFEDLRLDTSGFLEMNPELMARLAGVMGSRKVGFCAKLLSQMKERL
jgi:predicted transcriptional regulator of viral defense system